MATAWMISSDDLPAAADSVEDGDYAFRVDGERLHVGRIADGHVDWFGNVAISTLPRSALDGADTEAVCSEPPGQQELLLAAQGLESAERNRGG